MKRILQFIFASLVITSFIIPAIYFEALPDNIPIHFNFKGLPDAYESKNNIWLLPVLGLILPTILAVLINQLQKQKKKSPANSFPPYFAEILAIYLLVTFLFINYRTVLVGLGEKEGLGSWFLPSFMVVTFVGLSILIYQQRRQKRT